MQRTSNTTSMTITSTMRTTVSHLTKQLTLSPGTVQRQPIQTLSTQIHDVKPDAPPSRNSTTGMETVYSTGKTSTMTTTESSIFSTSIGIATLTMTETSTPSTVLCIVMTDPTQSILISMATVWKTTSIGMTITMVSLTFTTQTMATVEQSIQT